MACREIDTMRQQVSECMRGTLNTFQYQLQSRYGDPRVYAMQAAQMKRQEEAFAYDASKRKEHLLKEAYAVRAEKQRLAHSERMSKRRDYPSQDKPPRSVAGRSRKPAPLDEPAPAP